MRLTAHTDYALRVLIYLGVDPERLTTIREISERYDISRNHLMKIVNKLGQAGFVETVRGKHGGLRLGRQPETIVIGDVVRHMEDNFHIVTCFNHDQPNCQIDQACILSDVLQTALDQFLAVLDRCTLADLVTPKAHLVTLLNFAGNNSTQAH